MSRPCQPQRSLLLLGVIFKNNLPTVLNNLEKFGKFNKSQIIDFNFTEFYQKEFGAKLKKVLLVYDEIFDINKLIEVKLECYNLEYKEGKRDYNIDPGYITKSSVVLASFKPRPHRIYLDKGVYADLQLVYENKKWHSFNWTFPDMLKFSNFLLKSRQSIIDKDKHIGSDKSINETPDESY